jgi:hypothetical protein
MNILTVLVAAAAVLIISPPLSASAANGDGYCNSNEVCVYRNSNLGTPRSDFQYNYADMNGGFFFHTYNYPDACNTDPAAFPYCRLNDSISSIDSWSTTRSIRFFADAFYDGARQTVPIYGRSNQVTYNDQYSSECWNDGAVAYSVDHDCTF